MPQQFRLRRGAETFPPNWQVQPPARVVRYEADPAREYPAKLMTITHDSTPFGTCRVDLSTWTGLLLEPELGFPMEDAIFYAVFDVGEDGVAQLTSVRVIVREPPYHY